MKRFAILGLLYFVQGLPFGFQSTALPVYLRAEGVSLESIGFASALALPWMLKIFWAPLVDSRFSAKWGRRRSWILPMQIGLVACCVAASQTPPSSLLLTLLLLIFLMNLFAATMDIAVDGLAIDLLSERELGLGNSIQVVGYKLGMLTGGGLLLWLSETFSFSALFLFMGLGMLFAFFAVLSWREPGNEVVETRDKPEVSLRDVAMILRRAFRDPRSLWFLLFLSTYKLGESIADRMFVPFLVDEGFRNAEIGLWVGTWGMLFSIGGSIAGGALASRVPLLTAVGITATLRAIAVGGEAYLAWAGPTATGVVAVTSLEHFAGGALTTAMFALMMSRVDRRIGATHYTLFATIEVFGKMPGSFLSGVLASSLGYLGAFGLSAGLSVAFLFLLIPVSRAPAQSELKSEDSVIREREPEGVIDGH